MLRTSCILLAILVCTAACGGGGGGGADTNPTIASVAPDQGPYTGGTALTITGRNFPESPTIIVGALEATNVVRVDETTITCTTPTLTPGMRAGVIVRSGGRSGFLLDAFRVYPAPTVTSISPNIGPIAGGTAVTVAGSGFVANNAGANTVTIGGVPATGVVVLDDARISCVTPALPVGKHRVEVSNANGSDSISLAFETFEPALLYGTAGSDLYTVDETNGGTVPVGPIGYTPRAIAFHPDGTLFGVTTNNELIRIDATTGAGTLVAVLSTNPSPEIKDMAFWGTRLIAVNYRAQTYEIDTVTGAVTTKADFPEWFGRWRHGIGYDPVNGTLWQDSIGDSQRLTINPDTGSYSVQNVSGPSHATAVMTWFDGSMYMLSSGRAQSGSGMTLMRYNAAGTSVTSIGTPSVDLVSLAGAP